MPVPACPCLAVALATVSLLVAGTRQARAQPAPALQGRELRAAILAAEDRRAPTEKELRTLVSAIESPDDETVRLAVRALGRLERPALVPSLARALDSSYADVRLAAADALAQAVSRVSAVTPATETPARSSTAVSFVSRVHSLLLARLRMESDPQVRGVICESLGRLSYSIPEEMHAAERALVAATFGPTEGSESQARSTCDAPTGPVRCADLATLVRAVKGLESLLRQNAKSLEPSSDTLDRLRVLASATFAPRPPSAPGPAGLERAGTKPVDARPPGASRLARQPDPTGTEDDDAARVRRLALLALAARAAADEKTLSAAMDDEQWEVRRIAVRSAGAGFRTASRLSRNAAMTIVMRGLGDADWRVRYEALSAFARNQAAPECRVLLGALADRNPHVSLLAVDFAGKCGPASEAPRILGGLVRQLDSRDGSWHRPAHALVSLARLAPEQADAQLPRFVASPVPRVRAYAARAASLARSVSVLRTLAADNDDNVRTAAVTGLSEVEHHGADAVYIAQLSREDGELLMTAARALAGTPDRANAVPALVRALGRLTAAHRETSRDPRLALLERIGELGSLAQAAALDSYVRDFDPRVARAAAGILRRWTGVEPRVPPPGPPLAAPPTLEEVERLQGATAIVRMRNRGTFTLSLLADDAPASVVRFATLARAGYYDGLAFHRVEPVWLIQGGSPGGNEYSGDGPFMRDELGLASNRRGTVGVSTRGRDTGDAQWYINLADNARYDHNYTVFAIVTSGMDVVDTVMEGDAIESVRIVPAARLTGGD